MSESKNLLLLLDLLLSLPLLVTLALSEAEGEEPPYFVR
jgi:hypothetical protein